MAILEPLDTAIRTAMALVWPETKANGIYEVEHLDRIPWASLTPPFSSFVSSSASHRSLGASQYAFSVPVTMIYVCAINGSYAPIRTALDAMLQYIVLNQLSIGTLLSVDLLDWGNDIQGNTVMAAKNAGHRAGRISFTLLIGYGSSG